MTKHLIAIPRVPGCILTLSKSTDCFLRQFTGTQTATNTYIIRQTTNKIYKIPTEFHVLYHLPQFDCKWQSCILTQEHFLSDLNYITATALLSALHLQTLLRESLLKAIPLDPDPHLTSLYPLPRFILEWQYPEVTSFHFLAPAKLCILMVTFFIFSLGTASLKREQPTL